MKKIIKTAKVFLSTYYAYMLEYRAELFLWMLSSSLPFIMMGIWTEAAIKGEFPLDKLQFSRYFLAVFLVRSITPVWVIFNFEKEVVEGKLSPKLLQPIDPVWHHVADHIAERFARGLFVVGLILLFFVLYPQAFWLPNLGDFFLFLIVVLMAFFLRFLIQYTLAMCAFWTERATAIEQLWLLPYMFLSGITAPLEVFPEWVLKIVLWTPFPYLIHFPASLLVGLPVDVGRGLLVMLVWSVIFFGLNRWLWRLGLKQYSGMGA
ncbi:MAG: multidrug ABC transporter permease [Okeania sp. SIO3I5]|uniref:ABC transporter permease n=1 Tax=Okeania sp. SIO3I5 TaxID=2607805 RepID=UPI0013B6C7A2|nr:ABC-2 family transporter protein [Okeania sp. SIO3I5]NEQ41785.1 multidrug ABC transporter permease [Okeania sp. SIO3I5]